MWSPDTAYTLVTLTRSVSTATAGFKASVISFTDPKVIARSGSVRLKPDATPSARLQPDARRFRGFKF